VLLNMAEDDPERQLRLTALRQGLVALGWIENRNIRIDYRFGGGDDPVRVRALAAELVTSAPDLIVAHTSPVVTALKAATHAIPIIFAVVNDPVGQGIIASVARPGGNVTGFTYIDFEMMGKWLELLKEIAPSVTRAALIFNPATAFYQAWARELATMPKRPASEIVAEPVRDQVELEAAVAAIARDPGGGLIIVADVFNTTHRRSIISWLIGIASRRCTSVDISRRKAVCCPMVPTSPIFSGVRPHISIESSMAQILPICLHRRRQNSSSSSTSRPPRLSAWRSRRPF
jgi:ABC transporter substrate binding protein